MNRQKQITISIVLNTLIIVFEIIGLILNLKNDSLRVFLNYDQINNLLLMIVSGFLVYFNFMCLKKEKEIPQLIILFKYIVTSMVMLTFIDQAFVIPSGLGFNKIGFLLFQGSALFLHTLCPLLSLVSLLFYERVTLKKYDYLLATIPTVAYGVIMLLLNYLKVITGPYGYFLVHETSIKELAPYLFILLLASYLVSLLLKAAMDLLIKHKK